MKYIYQQIFSLHGDYRYTIYRSSSYGEVYDFGVAIGIAEGQASAKNKAALAIALNSMDRANSIARNLERYGINSNDMPVTNDYKTITNLRQRYQPFFTNSSDF
ncbi:MAG: hypothetical protein DCF22_15870 [Leptolyngbya sp.]|nr:MAG: hypothetical protein DCF22_15870 [Leptolyngbya sp.]